MAEGNLLTKDQFFEIWYPSSYWGQGDASIGYQDTANSRRNARESPNGRRQFNEAWQNFNKRQILLGGASNVEEPFKGYKAPTPQRVPNPPPGVNFKDWLDTFNAQYEAAVEYERVSNKALQAIIEQKSAIAEQTKQEEAIKAKYSELAAEAQTQAGIAKKESSALLGRERTRSRIAATQAQEQMRRATPQERQTRQSGASVGQPGVSRTRVGTRLSLGGYGGTTPGRVNPTGLNI